uniref:Uncharacterized protein n=1 Tax=Oryza sativa subsp. japonica TaxID=39947 RepID=Q69NG2_ORYSJ|nr:hypothetical protein [Oryza sativa Japonica Group]
MQSRQSIKQVERGQQSPYLVAAPLEAADLLAGEAGGGLLALDVGERGARPLHPPLGGLDPFHQRAVLLAQQQLVHLLPHRRAQPRRRLPLPLPLPLLNLAAARASPRRASPADASASASAPAAAASRSEGTRGRKGRGMDERTEEGEVDPTIDRLWTSVAVGWSMTANIRIQTSTKELHRERTARLSARTASGRIQNGRLVFSDPFASK